jgi:SAM-dependent methyltransferase
MKKKWEDDNGNIHEGPFCGSKNEFDVIDCSLCGFKHVIPIPSEDFLNNYYKKEFIKNRPAGNFDRVEEDNEWWKISYNELYDFFEKYKESDKRNILDVGSGLGYFLKCGKDRGWVVTGIEPSIDSYNYSKNLEISVKNEYLDKNNFKNFGTFDVINMNMVIEHLPDPGGIIEIAKEMLNKKGLLCISSPNDFNPLQEAFIQESSKEKWWISPPEHINYFDFDSIKRLLTSKGFKIVEQTTSFPLELFLLMGDDYIGNRDLGREMHLKRVALEKNLYRNGFENIRRDLYTKLSDIGLGREFCVVAQLDEG